MANDTRLLYIAGYNRCGSTLLEQMLGQLDGWFSCGEVHFIWHNQPCGCGARTRECEFWAPLLDDVFEGQTEERSKELLEIQRRHLGTSPLNLLAIRRAAEAGDGSPLVRYANALARIYAAVAERTRARVVVDNSKIATDAYLVSCLTDANLYVVHLVRDPRATAYSWGRVKLKNPNDPDSYFKRLGPAQTSAHWLRRNVVIETMLRPRVRDRYLRLRYEDLVSHPREALSAIAALLGDEDARLPLVDDHTVMLGLNHTVAGNPVRFSSGARRIEADDEWRTTMDASARRLATLPAAPLMSRYGYPLVAG